MKKQIAPYPSFSLNLKSSYIIKTPNPQLVEFCSRGHIIADIRYPDKDANRRLSKLFGDPEVETYPNRGQMHC